MQGKGGPVETVRKKMIGMEDKAQQKNYGFSLGKGVAEAMIKRIMTSFLSREDLALQMKRPKFLVIEMKRQSPLVHLGNFLQLKGKGH